MAQKRIDYYGRFTPTGVDTSQAKRLQALSGLAEQVGDVLRLVLRLALLNVVVLKLA